MPARALTGASGAWRRWTLSSLGIAIATRLVAGPLPLNYYDVGYALLWGREILDGHLPDYRTPGASTPHPLGTLLATVAAAFGTSAGWCVVQAIMFISLGVAGTALFLLTRTCLVRAGAGARQATAAGALAVAALLLTRPFLTDAVGGSGLSDLPALALVLAAAAIAAARPGRSRGPLVLLGLAGLMRPEAWGLAGAYWLYLALTVLPRRQLVEAAVLVAAAPVIWALCDLVVVGDPAYSLTQTQAASHTGIFAHGIGQVPRAAGRGLRALVGLPVLVVGAAGALTALVLARRATAPALALLGLALAEFAALGVANVPLIERFLLIVAAMTCLFFAYAVVGARDHVLGRLGGHHRPLKLAWTGLAVLVVAYAAAQHLSGVVHVRADQRVAVHAEADLLALARRPEVRAAVGRCPTFYVPVFTLTSLVAYDFGLPPQTILRTASKPPALGLILVPVTRPAGAYFGVTSARVDVLRRFTASRPISENRSWRLVARGCP
ncbi:MAG: hypothetical protein ACR2KV_01815 [Solirubrobacteraceae bacterium]